MMDIAAAEEEINRWKVAAEQEAAAGRGVEQEFVAQVWNAICWQDFFFWHVCYTWRVLTE
jgi:membrane protein required for beta-lactamase induction